MAQSAQGPLGRRVQSVTVRLICDREKEIQAFQSDEYWTVGLKLRKGKSAMFQSDLTQVDGKKLAVTDDNGKNFVLHNEKRPWP